ncbi:FMN-dependent NADH-azoreductase [Wenjunlia tyrosinilytica]|uniref:FMN dependent NADH:quinone oxidoreductase n=1 Tax=Wenjunlia tyrosinilytica TaxID=1544741 RepID=A0A917ZLA5_9ACTN|nr:NAD(P)H-dependent oxidoreductase [Wenjunlia tyrosinilytica]GGO86102.1 FMN-dependent NADH-azoreductase [Wenjunlia tyrosinilytica]
MSKLLHIDSSALQEGSVSRDVAATFRTAWEDKHPGGTVVYRDLGASPLPHLGADGISARFAEEAGRTAEQRTAAALQDKLINELLEADAYLFSVPMYNFTITSTFKAWLDHVLIFGRTIGLENGSPFAGRPATVISSRGGSYAEGTPREGWDFAEPYLRKVFTEALGMETTIIVPELTLAHVNPAMAELRDAADASRAKAHEDATTRAHEVAAKLAA